MLLVWQNGSIIFVALCLRGGRVTGAPLWGKTPICAAGPPQKALLRSLVFSAPERVVLDVHIDGAQVVAKGRALTIDPIPRWSG